MRMSDWCSDVCSSCLRDSRLIEQVAPVSVKTLLDGREELFGIVVAGLAGASPFRRSPERGRLVDPSRELLMQPLHCGTAAANGRTGKRAHESAPRSDDPATTRDQPTYGRPARWRGDR